MAQTRPDLGRSIFTPGPKPKPTARRTGNMWPAGHEHHGSAGPSTASRQYVPPTPNMTETTARLNTTVPPPYSGKGKGPATLPSHAAASPLDRQARNSAAASSLASPPIEHAELPILTSDVKLAPTAAHLAALRYQAEVDRLEKERDDEDSTFSVPLSQEDAVGVGRPSNTPRTRSRMATNGNLPELSPTWPKQRVANDCPPAAPPVQQKRKAAENIPLEEPLRKKQQPSTKFRHNNTRFEKLKPESQTRRKYALGGIKSCWKISDALLMGLPFAPRRTTDVNQPIMVPLDWNTRLLEAVAQLALATKGDFARACGVAKEAFEVDSLFNGANQLTSEIVQSAITWLHDGTHHQGAAPATNGQTTSVSDERRQNVTGGASPEHPVAGGDPQRTVNKANGNPSGGRVSPPSLMVKLATRQRAPPSPATSPPPPAMQPIKTEAEGSGTPQHGISASEDESSGTEELAILEAKARLCRIESALACERVRICKLERKKQLKDVEKMRQHGCSAEDALLL